MMQKYLLNELYKASRSKKLAVSALDVGELLDGSAHRLIGFIGHPQSSYDECIPQRG